MRYLFPFLFCFLTGVAAALTMIKVNIYPVDKDVSTSKDLQSSIKIGISLMQTLKIPVYHSALEAWGEEWNFVIDPLTKETKWTRKKLGTSLSIQPTRSIFFCETNIHLSLLKIMLARYAEQNSYNLLENNCNDAAFKMADLICKREPNFKPIPQPKICTRSRNIGKFINRHIYTFNPSSSSSSSTQH